MPRHYEKFSLPQCGRKLDGLTPAAEACVRAYGWPGNLRELRNAIERAVIMARGDQLAPEDFPTELRGQNPSTAADGENELQVGSLTSLEKLEEAHLRKVLAQTPSLSEAAEILGIDQATLYRKRKNWGLNKWYASTIGGVKLCHACII